VVPPLFASTPHAGQADGEASQLRNGEQPGNHGRHPAAFRFPAQGPIPPAAMPVCTFHRLSAIDSSWRTLSRHGRWQHYTRCNAKVKAAAGDGRGHKFRPSRSIFGRSV